MMNLLSVFGAFLLCSTYVSSAPQTPPAQSANQSQYSPQIQKIIKSAKGDGIDLLALPFAAAAFAGIEEVSKPVKINHTVKAERICVHVHAIPSWYARLIPTPPNTPQALPPWSIEGHLAFMAANGKTLWLDLEVLLLNDWV